MASVGFDGSRAVYRVYWHDGLGRRSRVVARLAKGAKRPRKDPPEVARALAEAEVIELAARRDQPAGPQRTVRVFLATYRAWYAEHRAARSLEEFDRARMLLDSEAESRPLASFARSDAVRILDALEASGLAPGTIRQRVALLGGAWSWAMRRGEVSANPWRDLQLPDRVEPDRPSWTPEEFARLVEAARPWLRELLWMGVHTGLRVGELIAMPWSWIDWPDGRFGSIRVPAAASKSGRNRRIPLHRDAHNRLASRLARDGDDGGPILRGQTENPIGTRHQVNHAICAACLRAELPPVGSHAMRRSFGRWAVLGIGAFQGRPVPLYVVSQWLGHADVKTTQVYLALDESASDAWMAGPDDA